MEGFAKTMNEFLRMCTHTYIGRNWDRLSETLIRYHMMQYILNQENKDIMRLNIHLKLTCDRKSVISKESDRAQLYSNPRTLSLKPMVLYEVLPIMPHNPLEGITAFDPIPFTVIPNESFTHVKIHVFGTNPIQVIPCNKILSISADF